MIPMLIFRWYASTKYTNQKYNPLQGNKKEKTKCDEFHSRHFNACNSLSSVDNNFLYGI